MHIKMLINFSKNKGVGIKHNLVKALSMAVKIIISFFDATFDSRSLNFRKIFSDYFYALKMRTVV